MSPMVMTGIYCVAAVFQLAAMVFALRMILDAKDRRPWVVLFLALAITFVFRLLVMSMARATIDPILPYPAIVLSILWFIALFYIRTIAVAERESENRYQALVDLSPDAIFVNSDNRIVYINAAALRFFGATRNDQLLGRSPMDLVAPGSAELVRSRIETLRGDHAVVPVVEQRWIRMDGKTVPVEAVAATIPWRGGKAVQVILRDISDRKRAEEEKSNMLASERVLRSNAEHANRMKDEFLATLSHELRTPLNAILGWSQLLRNGGTEPDELQQGLDTIERNARAQTQLIEDLLDMSRIISGKLRLDMQRLIPATFVTAAMETVRPAAEAKGIVLEQTIDDAAGPVTGDPNRLQQITWNLLSNAVKFTPRGGKVQVRVQRVNSQVQVTVHDSGQGISAEFLPFVFERFRQADASSTRRHGGLGLGLSIAKQLADLHGGMLTAQSPGEGQGSTFTLQLPVLAVEAQATGSLQPAVNPTEHKSFTFPDLSGLKVLVVDDEADARELIRRVLAACRADVVTASSAEEAMKLIGRADILISDIGMPMQDGYEFLRRVRALSASENGRIPAIALTAFARSEDRTRAMMSGYQLHISKPVAPPELIAAVASLTSRMGDKSVSYNI